MSESHANEESTPRDLSSDDAFELVGNEVRLAILRALWEAPDEEVSFSELRERAGNPDSGQFNYHLKELLGSFVQQTEDGYKPRHTGTHVIRAILAGATDDPPQLDAFRIDGTCAFCGGDLEASYEDEDAIVRCQACGKIQMSEWLPPASFTRRSRNEVVHAFDRWVLHRSALLIDGVCPDCGGKPARSLFETRSASEGSRDYLRARYVCQNCAYECDVPIWLYVLLTRHPAVVSFYYGHGINLTELPIWELTVHGHRTTVTVQSEDPVRIDVEIPLADDELCVTLDDELNIVDVPAMDGLRVTAD